MWLVKDLSISIQFLDKLLSEEKIGNHGFYEEIDYAQTHSSSSSPYYGFIVDDEGKWVDSHFFGVDGPLLHLDKDNPNLLHFWLLSFERHAMVSHLTFPLSESN